MSDSFSKCMSHMSFPQKKRASVKKKVFITLKIKVLQKPPKIRTKSVILKLWGPKSQVYENLKVKSWFKPKLFFFPFQPNKSEWIFECNYNTFLSTSRFSSIRWCLWFMLLRFLSLFHQHCKVRTLSHSHSFLHFNFILFSNWLFNFLSKFFIHPK